VFGIGWGIAGICPAPGLVLLGMAQGKGLVFVGTMLGGMALFELFEVLQRRKATDRAKA
jgi:uncharacterized membrane protein YedE/YeeE